MPAWTLLVANPVKKRSKVKARTAKPLAKKKAARKTSRTSTRKTRKRTRKNIGRRYEPSEYRQWFLDGVAESEGVESGDVSSTPRLDAEWDRFEADLDRALVEWARKNRVSGDKIDEMRESDPELNVFHTLEGAGVGIWDGRWDHILTSTQISDLTKHLKMRLGKYVDDTGGGSLNDYMREAVWESSMESNPRSKKVAKKKTKKRTLTAKQKAALAKGRAAMAKKRAKKKTSKRGAKKVAKRATKKTSKRTAKTTVRKASKKKATKRTAKKTSRNSRTIRMYESSTGRLYKVHRGAYSPDGLLKVEYKRPSGEWRPLVNVGRRIELEVRMTGKQGGVSASKKDRAKLVQEYKAIRVPTKKNPSKRKSKTALSKVRQRGVQPKKRAAAAKKAGAKGKKRPVRLRERPTAVSMAACVAATKSWQSPKRGKKKRTAAQSRVCGPGAPKAKAAGKLLSAQKKAKTKGLTEAERRKILASYNRLG